MTRLEGMLCALFVLAVVGPARADDTLVCAIWPVDVDEATGNYLFYTECCPVSGGVADCDSRYPSLDWYDSNYDGWPEYCPDCSSSELLTARTPARLGSPISPCESLCSLAPARMKDQSGRCVEPRRGIIVLAHHDIQVRSPAGGRMVSVRLFEAKVRPCCAGLKGAERIIHCGFETTSPVIASCRPFEGQLVGKNPYQVIVDYHGTKFAVLTRTAMASESLALTAAK